ncbi:MAG: hypothetical protein GSR86_04755 [Desulfurococcales archaeon]|nr:hypothetical protein [Desulfurococcales archaeon]
MRPFTTRMLLVQALAEARHSMIRLRSIFQLSREYGFEPDIRFKAAVILGIVEEIARELDSWTRTPRLDPRRVLSVLEASRVALSESRSLSPEVELAIDKLSMAIAHVYSIVSDGVHDMDRAYLDSILSRAYSRAREMEDAT